MSRSRTPNKALRGLLAESGWTEEELARQVNALAAETGAVMRLDRRSVAHWLAGRRPRPPVPELVAEAFSRRLGRTVTVTATLLGTGGTLGNDGTGAQTGANIPGSQPFSQAEDVVTMLKHLAQFNGDRRGVLVAGAYSLSALAVPTWVQAVAGHALPRTAEGGREGCAPPLTAEQVTAAEQMARMFSDMDTTFGGGHSRQALASYLACDIAPRLRASASPALRMRALSVAARLTYLCGFMCFDDEQHALAQQYYRAALGLAAEAAEAPAYAITLRATSHQARLLGHHRQALDLAQSAAAIGSRKVGAARQAFFLGQVAVAAAAAGERTTALANMSAAERCLSQATSRSSARPAPDSGGVIGSYHPASLTHQEAAVRAFLHDRPGAVKALTASIQCRPAVERRSRAVTMARLAELHLRQGNLDQAIAAWQVFLDDLPLLQSGRATTALTTMRALLAPFRNNPGVKRLLRAPRPS